MKILSVRDSSKSRAGLIPGFALEVSTLCAWQGAIIMEAFWSIKQCSILVVFSKPELVWLHLLQLLEFSSLGSGLSRFLFPWLCLALSVEPHLILVNVCIFIPVETRFGRTWSCEKWKFKDHVFWATLADRWFQLWDMWENVIERNVTDLQESMLASQTEMRNTILVWEYQVFKSA